MKNMIRCVIYDLDGTLIDSSYDLAAAVNAARIEFNLEPLSVTEVMNHLGGGAENLVRKSFAGAEVDLVEALQFFKRSYADNTLVKTTLYPQVAATVRRLHEKRIMQAVATNKPLYHSEKILSGLNLASFFTHIVGGDSGLGLKPDPAALLAIAGDNNVSVEECLMVGDNHTDLEAALNCGMKSVFCSFGLGSKAGFTPDYEISCFSELDALTCF